MHPVKIYSCPDCSLTISGALKQPGLVVCRACDQIVFQERTNQGLEKKRPPEDWTFIQIGTEGDLEGEAFLVTGRLRLQLRNDYKNIWTILLKSGRIAWIAESFASFVVLQSAWNEYNDDVRKLRAGQVIPVSTEKKYFGEYLEKCYDLAFEGETAQWREYKPGFFLVQCSTISGEVAFIPFEPKKDIYFLEGVKTTREKLNLKNIVTWNEWQ